MLNGVRVDYIFYFFFLYTNEMLVRDDNEMVASKVWLSSTFIMNNMLKANYVFKVMILINQSIKETFWFVLQIIHNEYS